jgi:pyridoxal 5'-phosphate synthase pdxS subunit
MASNGANGASASNSFTVKAGLAQMLKGGVIMDVINAEQVWEISNTIIPALRR